MLSFFSEVFTVLKGFITFLFIASLKTGQIITSVFMILLNTLKSFFEILLVVIQVIFEDFNVFLNDLHLNLTNLKNCLSANISSMMVSVDHCLQYVNYFTCRVIGGFNDANALILKIFRTLFTSLGTFLMIIKEIIILIGQGTWFAITFVPIGIFTLIKTFICCANNALFLIIAELISLIQVMCDKLTVFFEFPLEAIAGLIAGSFLAYLLIKFHIVGYHLILPIARRVRLYFDVIMRQLRLRRRESVMVIDSNSEDNYSNSDMEEDSRNFSENLLNCLVCLERSRNVVLLPCRHLCVCIECNERLKRLYVRNCPLCRTRVYRSMKIFV